MSSHTAILAKLALRNLHRQLRRTLLTASAMVLGGALLMFSIPLGDGTHEAWIESAVRMGSGHVSLEAPGFRASRKIEDRLSPDIRALAESALAQPELADRVVATAPQLSVTGLASSPSSARPVMMVAVEPEREALFSVLDDSCIEGRYLSVDDGRNAYVPSGLAESLDLRIGSRLVLTAQDAGGDIASLLVRVTGIFRTGIPEIDQSVIHIPLSAAGEWLGTGSDITTLAVLLDESGSVSPVTSALNRALREPTRNGSLTVMGWREANPILDAAVKIDDFGNYLFQGILFSIIALGILNTVLMSVLHRYREFGVLQALGLTPSQAGRLVLIEGLLLTMVSGILGLCIGMLTTWYFWGDGLDITGMWNEEWSFAGVVMDPVIVPLFRLSRVIQALVFLVVIGLFASFYPAYRASRVDVTEAMKFER